MERAEEVERWRGELELDEEGRRKDASPSEYVPVSRVPPKKMRLCPFGVTEKSEKASRVLLLEVSSREPNVEKARR